MRLFDTVSHTARELRQAWTVGDDVRSRLRLAADVLLYRVLRVFRLPETDRHVRLAGGVHVTYRLNRGDIQSVREIWFDEAYKLPFPLSPRVIVDLGANIGMTSLWYSRRYRPARLVAIEPSPANVRVLKKNLADNGIACEVIEAAVGPTDGTASFMASQDSNLGTVLAGSSGAGFSVPLVSMTTVLGTLTRSGFDSIDLLKIDIEGGETDLFSQRLEWLDHVGAIAIEFHPDRVDYPGLVSHVSARGLRFIPGGSVAGCDTDTFVREAPADHAAPSGQK